METFRNLAATVLRALRSYPHYVVVKGFPAVEERSNLIALSRAIGAVAAERSRPAAGSESREKISFTKVRIDSAKASAGGQVTSYSRTHYPLPLHTDSSYMAHPHELVAFQCIVAAEAGGESIVAPVEDILSGLDRETLTLLQAPVYRFGREPAPIVFGEPGDEHIRYYRAQLDRASTTGTVALSDAHIAALKALDETLQQTERFRQFRLEAGHVAFLHNTKVLHGRQGFSERSDRLLYRVRLHVPGLGAGCPPAAANLASAPSAIAAPPQATPVAATTGAPKSEPQAGDTAAAQLTLARQLKQSHRLNDALEQYLLASESATDDRVEFTACEGYGHLALQVGQFAAATQAFRRCLEIEPQNYDCGLALSSLLYKSGDGKAARGILNRAVRDYPLVFLKEPDPAKPTLLRARGLEGSAYAIVKQADGTYSNLLRGGHFSIKHLVKKQRYNIGVLNVFENNADDLADMPKFDLFLNTIACPDLKRKSLLTTARFLDRYPNVPVINQPRRVLETTRERNALRLNVIPGVSFPKTEKFWWDGHSLEAIVKEIAGWGFTFPLIVRQLGTQTGSSVMLANSRQDLQGYLQRSPANREYYVIQFRDCRRFERVYSKTRVFFIDGKLYPVAHLFDETWNIHSGDRYSLMAKVPWMQHEERRFLGDPLAYLGDENYEKLYTICELVGLDFFGIDFTVLPDSELFIFELNAAMRHNFDHAANFPYTKPHLQRISQAFDAMLLSRIPPQAAAE